MEDIREEYRIVRNPYVTQADRFAQSLKHLGEKFLKIEEQREQFLPQEIQDMCEIVERIRCASPVRKEKAVCDREKNRFIKWCRKFCARWKFMERSFM